MPELYDLAQSEYRAPSGFSQYGGSEANPGCLRNALGLEGEFGGDRQPSGPGLSLHDGFFH